MTDQQPSVDEVLDRIRASLANGTPTGPIVDELAAAGWRVETSGGSGGPGTKYTLTPPPGTRVPGSVEYTPIGADFDIAPAALSIAGQVDGHHPGPSFRADVRAQLDQQGPTPDDAGPITTATRAFRATPPPPTDDPQRIELDGPGPLPEPVRLAVVAWLARHGIDADDVCSPGIIERQPRRRRVIVEQYLRDGRGGRYVDATDEEAAREITVYDIATDVEPFPELALQYAAGIRAHQRRQQETTRGIAHQLRQLERNGQTGILLRTADVRAVLNLGCGAQVHRQSGGVQTCVRTVGHHPDPHRDITGQTWHEL